MPGVSQEHSLFYSITFISFMVFRIVLSYTTYLSQTVVIYVIPKVVSGVFVLVERLIVFLFYPTKFSVFSFRRWSLLPN